MHINHFLGFKIKQIDTHVKGTLTECQIARNGRISNKINLKDYIVFPKEIFLYWCIKKVISSKAIEKSTDFTHFDDYFQTLLNPTELKIGGEYKSRIEKYRQLYEVTIAVLAVDEKFSRVDISIQGAWNYSFGQLVLSKPLLESMIKKLNAKVVFPTIWTDIEYRLNKIKPQIQHSNLMRPFRSNIINAMDIILDSPVIVLFSNSFRMLAPNVEGIVKAYISHKGISGIRTKNLSTMVGGLANYNGPEFSSEFKEYLKIVLEPIRNLSLHGGLPSESVCKILIVVILELIEEILNKE